MLGVKLKHFILAYLVCVTSFQASCVFASELALDGGGSAAPIQINGPESKDYGSLNSDEVLPAGVVYESNPLKQAYLAKKPGLVKAVFRPNPSMPELTNQDVLKGMTEGDKDPRKMSQFLGYIPKLKVLRCAKGCEGAGYERAVKEFIKGFRGNSKYYEERGEMIVQVRWFNERPFLMRQLPYTADVFGVSFILEGKLVSLGKSSGVGVSVSAYELTRDMGARLASDLFLSVGMGVRSNLFTAMNEGSLAGVATGLSNVNTAINGSLGVEDVRSRIEPVTDAYKHLLPAIDGIGPNEVRPVTEMKYISTLLF